MSKIKATVVSSIVLSATGFFPSAGQSNDLQTAPSETILTFTSDLDGQASDVTLNLAMLEEMDAVTFSTSTIWTEGTQVFTGVPLSRLIHSVDGGGVSVTLKAMNDYSVTIPLAEVRGDYPIVAYLNNGEPMSIRDKGPLWVVYPYDLSDEYRSEVVYARSIWQLDRIEFGE